MSLCFQLALFHFQLNETSLEEYEPEESASQEDADPEADPEASVSNQQEIIIIHHGNIQISQRILFLLLLLLLLEIYESIMELLPVGLE